MINCIKRLINAKTKRTSQLHIEIAIEFKVRVSFHNSHLKIFDARTFGWRRKVFEERPFMQPVVFEAALLADISSCKKTISKV